jgi:hypothetical protein
MTDSCVLYVACVLVIKVWITLSFNNQHETHGLEY